MNFFDKCAKERKKERWSFSILNTIEVGEVELFDIDL